jgi:hypothetical protein
MFSYLFREFIRFFLYFIGEILRLLVNLSWSFSTVFFVPVIVPIDLPSQIDPFFSKVDGQVVFLCFDLMPSICQISSVCFVLVVYVYFKIIYWQQDRKYSTLLFQILERRGEIRTTPSV